MMVMRSLCCLRGEGEGFVLLPMTLPMGIRTLTIIMGVTIGICIDKGFHWEDIRCEDSLLISRWRGLAGGIIVWVGEVCNWGRVDTILVIPFPPPPWFLTLFNLARMTNHSHPSFVLRIGTSHLRLNM